MQVRCPHCSLVFATQASGIQPCQGCGQPINVPVPPGAAALAQTSPGATCPRHRERPATGTCTRCGNFTCDECSQGNTATCPACRAQAPGPLGREPTAWERRSELGLVQAAWQTWKKSLLEPEKFWSSVSPQGSAFDAVFYGWVITVLAAVPTFFMNWLNFKGLQAQLTQVLGQLKDVPPEVLTAIDKLGSNSAAFALGFAISSVLFYPLSLLISAALTHLGCLVFGAGKNGFGATLRVLAYSSGPALFAWIPMVGAAAGIYIIVLEVWGITRVQETSVGRSLGGVLAIPVLVSCCLSGLLVAAFVAAVSG
jgi:hypothetical protein